MRTYSFALLFSFIFISCEDLPTREADVEEVISVSIKPPRLITKTRPTHAVLQSSIRLNRNDFLGLGYTADKKVSLDHLMQPDFDYKSLGKRKPKYQDEVHLFVDYNQLLTMTSMYFSNDSSSYILPDSLIKRNWIQEYEKSDNLAFEKQQEAYPLFIYNKSEDYTTLMLQDGALILIQEARDKYGNWRPIEYWEYSNNGNSYWEFEIFPNQFAVTKIYKYTGEFETELRIKLKSGSKVYYSNSFKGSIDPNQFDFDKETNLSRWIEKDPRTDLLLTLFLER